MGSFDVPWSEWSDPNLDHPKGINLYLKTKSTALICFAVTGFSEVGGYEGLKDKYMMAVSNDTLYSNSSCGRPREDSFVMLRDPINSDMPWAGFIFGQTIASIWYWCADQVSFVPFSEIFYMISNLHFCLVLFNDISQNTILFIYYYFIGAERIWLVLHL